MKLVIVTGVSGAGKSTALRALEDLGFYCADNLPLPLLPEVHRAAGEPARRSTGPRWWSTPAAATSWTDAAAMLAGLRAAGHPVEVLFLDAPDEVLIRRFSETRRRHPLSGNDIRAGAAGRARAAGGPAPGGRPPWSTPAT